MAIVEKTAIYYECDVCGMQYSWPIEVCMNQYTDGRHPNNDPGGDDTAIEPPDDGGGTP
jgi:hypothetical protein